MYLKRLACRVMHDFDECVVCGEEELLDFERVERVVYAKHLHQRERAAPNPVINW